MNAGWASVSSSVGCTEADFARCVPRAGASLKGSARPEAIEKGPSAAGLMRWLPGAEAGSGGATRNRSRVARGPSSPCPHFTDQRAESRAAELPALDHAQSGELFVTCHRPFPRPGLTPFKLPVGISNGARASGPLATQVSAEVSRPSSECVSPHVSLILITIH